MCEVGDDLRGKVHAAQQVLEARVRAQVIELRFGHFHPFAGGQAAHDHFVRGY